MTFFVGEFRQAIDVKNRLTIPMSLRSAMEKGGRGSEFVLVPGPSRYLWMFPAEDIQRIMSPQMEAAYRDAGGLAVVVAMMKFVQADARGRIVISTKVLRLAGLGREVVMVGVADHIEIWPPEQWERRVMGSIPLHGETSERSDAPLPPAGRDGGHA
jgi:MraZ protein